MIKTNVTTTHGLLMARNKFYPLKKSRSLTAAFLYPQKTLKIPTPFQYKKATQTPPVGLPKPSLKTLKNLKEP